MPFVIVKLTKEQFHDHIYKTGPMLLGTTQVKEMASIDAKELRELGLWDLMRQAMEEE